jgi:putative FmdB family regulatory protein
MPTYEYNCDKCGPFELWQSIKDDALTACPACGSRVQRLLSANVGFVLKGAGFYQNDYKTQPAAKPEAKPSTGAAPGCGTCGGPDPCPNN